jgi:hypothetical protein
MLEKVGWRVAPYPETISGFISGYRTSGGSFILLSEIIGPNQSSFALNPSGYIMGSSGYFLSGQQYFFPTGTGISNRFTGFSGMFGFEESMGYQYSGIFSDISSNFFSGKFPDSSGGNTGIVIGKIGYRNVPTRKEISGFIKAESLYNFSGFNYTGINISGLSGYFIDNKAVSFLTGAPNRDLLIKGFEGFDNESGFDNFGYEYSGFFTMPNSGFSGLGMPYLFPETVTGFVSGFLSGENNTFVRFTGFSGSSGYILSGNKYYFLPSFNGFNGLEGFNSQQGYQYIVDINTFNYTNANFIGESGRTSGLGVVTGNIGYRNIIKLDKNFGTGIMTGIIGYRNVPYMSPFSGKFYRKDKYGNKNILFPFSINSGEFYKEYDSNSIGFFVSGGSRLGIDIENTLSGIGGVNIVMEGYYD